MDILYLYTILYIITVILLDSIFFRIFHSENIPTKINAKHLYHVSCYYLYKNWVTWQGPSETMTLQKHLSH